MELLYAYHPTLGVVCRSDGYILIPQDYNHKAHWANGITRGRYAHVRIRNKHYAVHRLIAEAFLPNPDNLPQVDHINRNKKDNRLENLRWVTAEENSRNRTQTDRVMELYGGSFGKDQKTYSKLYKQTHLSLHAVKPDGKDTRYWFKSADDPLYRLLFPLSGKERYFKYMEYKHE